MGVCLRAGEWKAVLLWIRGQAAQVAVTDEDDISHPDPAPLFCLPRARADEHVQCLKVPGTTVPHQGRGAGMTAEAVATP